MALREDRVEIHASSANGFFYAAVTLAQYRATANPMRCITVADSPKYPYRGLLIDCARHFHCPGTIKRMLDVMASLKLNRLHWHLTDDEGWRLEVPTYPELTDIGAWRGFALPIDPQYGSGAKRYGGFYSTDDVKEIVAYAAERCIEIVPEIDVPGHSRAALIALPALLVEEADRSNYRSVQHYSDNALNPGLPGTYQFIDTVLEHVCDLFPGSLIHIGGDEVPEGAWQLSPACKAACEREGFGSVRELHQHFLRHIQTALERRGKVVGVWEEAALTGGVSNSAQVYAWTGNALNESASVTAKVLCNAPHLYLDLAWSDDPVEPGLYWAGTTDLKATFEFTPMGEEKVVGLQAQLWSELIPNESALQSMALPRLFAVAETAWSLQQTDFSDFLSRCRRNATEFRKRGINVRSF